MTYHSAVAGTRNISGGRHPEGQIIWRPVPQDGTQDVPQDGTQDLFEQTPKASKDRPPHFTKVLGRFPGKPGPGRRGTKSPHYSAIFPFRGPSAVDKRPSEWLRHLRP